MAVLTLDDLTVEFDTPDGAVRAVRGVSLAVREHETLAVVGESGSGKSQSFLAVMGLLARNGVARGGAIYGGRNLLTLDAKALDQVRGADIGMVFQDPMTALNPALRISRQLTETLEAHAGVSRREADERAIDMLARVGIPDPKRRFRMYPHELSGGMRQRIVIAMALLNSPKLIIADEPTTALDVTIQAQILDLFAELQRETGAALILITHDLGVVARLADRVAVMYAGRIVEEAPVDALFDAPRHPYTAALLASTPRPDEGLAALRPIAGRPPNLQRLPAGCPFGPRCAHAVARCGREEPPLDGRAACWNPLPESAVA